MKKCTRRNRTATFSTCRNTNYASSFCQEKNVSFINKIKIPNVVVIHRGNTQKEFFAKVKDALIKIMTERQEEYMKLQEGF